MRTAAGQVYRGSRVLVGEQIKPATVVVEGGKITAVHDGIVEVPEVAFEVGRGPQLWCRFDISLSCKNLL